MEADQIKSAVIMAHLYQVTMSYNMRTLGVLEALDVVD